MSKLNGMQIFELLSDLNDNLIMESVAPALLVGGATGVVAGLTGGAYSSSAGTVGATAAKGGFAAWLAKGGWLAVLAGVLVAAGVAVGVTLAGREQGSIPPVDTDGVTTVRADVTEPEETEGGDATETPTEEVSEETTETLTEEITAPPHEHVFNEWAFTVKPTCTEGGTRRRSCTVENCTVCETEDWPAGLHDYGDEDTCTLCGHDFSTYTKMQYSTNGDGTCSVYVTVTRISEVVIPNYSKAGDLVTELQERFATHTSSTLTAVTLPEGLRIIGEYAFYNSMNLATVNIPDSLQVIGDRAFQSAVLLDVQILRLPEGLVSIGEQAFLGGFFSEVIIPSTVTELGEQTFRGCPRLTAITFAEGSSITALPGQFASECTALTSMTIPDGVTDIGESAFYQCASLANVELPAGLLTVGDWAFTGCPIAELTVPDGVTSLGKEAFANNDALESVTIPASVTALRGYVFSSCGSLTEIAFAEGGLLTVLPDGFVSGCKKLTAMDLTGFTALGDYAFYNTSLQTVILSDSLTSIGAGAFKSTALTEIVIPASVTEIGEGCFWNCPSLQTVAFAEGSALTRIPTRFVMGCPELTSVTLPDTLAWVEDFAFAECPKLPMTEYEGCLYLAMWNNPYAILCDTVSEEITEVTIHPDTRHVAGGAFSDCEKLTAVILPEGVVSVGSRAFRHCYALASVQLPDSLRYIADYAFYGCAGELEPTLPADLVYIGIGIFEQCRNERVYYQGTQAQWEAIPKHKAWISRYDAYDLICADGVIRIEG